VDGLEVATVFSVRQDLKKSAVELSIVIVSHNVRENLRQCLKGLAIEPDFYEVLVVDNHSQDGTIQMLEKEYPWVGLIKNQVNLGFSRAANQGMKLWSGDFILLLNPDTLANPADLRPMLEYLRQNRRVGILGCQILDTKGERQFSGRSFPGFNTSFSSNQSILNRILPNNPWSKSYLGKELNLDAPGEVDWVSGSCLLLKREMLKQTGLLDERFFMYVEDVDLCKRARENSWKVVYFPQVKIIHSNGRSVRKRKLKMLAEHHKSMYYYFTKHYGHQKIFVGLVYLGVWLRAGVASLGYWLRN